MAADSTKAGQLAAAAQNGQGGVNAYNQAINNVGANNQQALSAAAGRAGALDAPSQFIAKQAGVAGLPGASSLPLLHAQQGAMANFTGALNAANSQYNSSIPTSQALLAHLAQQQMPGVQFQAQRGAASYYESLNRLNNLLNKQSGGMTPTEARAEQQYQWALQAHQQSAANDSLKQRQPGILQNLSQAATAPNQSLIGAIGQAPDYSSALATIQGDDVFKNADPQTKVNMLGVLQSYYDPNWVDPSQTISGSQQGQ